MRSKALPINNTVLRMIEHLACRLAERSQGRIAPPHLMPYVPLPLEVLRACLDDMVDDEAMCVVSGEAGAVYQFHAYGDLPLQPGELSLAACVACGVALLSGTPSVLCPGCTAVLHAAGERLARQPGWALQAHLEHALFYAAAPQAGAPVSLATLASRSHTRMRATRQALEKLVLDGYIRQEADSNTGAMVYIFPTMAYAGALYQANSGVLKTWAGERHGRVRWQRSWWLSVCGTVVLLGGLICWYGTPSPPPSRPLPRSAVVPRPVRPATPPTVAAPVMPSSPVYGQAYHEEAMKHATPVRVAIGQDGFTPVTMKVPASWNSRTQLSPTPPPRITREPVYRGSGQYYGTLQLGTRPNNLYDFVFDLIAAPNPVVYFDANQNGDLSDDGPPRTNQGSGIFAATIHLPFRRLVQEAAFPGDFHVWFFTNDTMWPRGAVAHYSRTQLKGTVAVDGTTYVAYIADAGNNDADLTNDGISVDVNGDGNIDRQQEFFPPDRVAHILGKAYVFVITW